MRHIWSVLCQHCIVDGSSNNLNLINIPDRVEFKGELPAERPLELPLHSPFYIVSKWWADEGENKVYHALGRIISPAGKQLTEFGFSFEVKQYTGHRTTGKIETLLYAGDGIYEFQICTRDNANSEWRAVASIPLEIVHAES